MQTSAIILLGPPGAGKGTQAARLACALSVPAISTGELLRRECRSAAQLGRELERCLQSGRLVSDDLMNQVVFTRLTQADCESGFILDGYPRTVSQARYLDTVFARLAIRHPTIFDFEIPARDLMERLETRRQCVACGRIYGSETAANSRRAFCEDDGSPLVSRSDDHAAAIRERLRSYQSNAAELAGYYRSRNYHAIAAVRGPDEIACELLQLLEYGSVGDECPGLLASLSASFLLAAAQDPFQTVEKLVSLCLRSTP